MLYHIYLCYITGPRTSPLPLPMLEPQTEIVADCNEQEHNCLMMVTMMIVMIAMIMMLVRTYKSFTV